MHLEISTADWTANDARGLLALIEAYFPDVVRDAGWREFGADVINAPEYIGNNGPPLVGLATADEAFAEPPQLDPAAAFSTAPLADAGAPGIPAPPAGAPSPRIAGAPTPAQGVELDSQGLPWDARIHAATKSKNQDGRWKGKKGAAPPLIAQVKAELRQRYPEPGAPAAAAPPPPVAAEPPPPAPPAPVAPPPPQLDPAAVQAAQAAALADPVGFAEGQSPAAAFAGVMKRVGEAQRDGKVSAQDLQNICADLRLGSMRDLIANPDKIAPFLDQLDAYIASAG